jgi:deoxycytidine triphosphate deaminase
MMDTYRKSYASGINPMPSPDEWPDDEGVELIEPPQQRKQSGRPKKQRKIGVDEQPDESIKVSCKGYDVRCGNYGEKGHNARSCRKPNNPNRKKYFKQPKKQKVDISG